ncbi:translocator protein homolog [Andrographis paniculata]|uniref:translocator protein homolog n=1 Tax=Andrographis paniculata TaxID=175694 RepID=UPI0021E8990D|nr:translocator protein homolog [Andrographis paniculata]
MASQDIKLRPKHHQETQPEPQPSTKQRKTGTAARRGLRSLSVAVAVPVGLTLLDIFFFGSTRRKPFYFPPLWALHGACLATSAVLGLSAWLVWAEGGFHRRPSASILYLAQMALSLGWYPIVFGAGAFRVGLVLCGALIGSLVGCTRVFRSMNRTAGDLSTVCLVWALLVSVVNVRLLWTTGTKSN